MIDLFGFSAGARRLLNSALRASPKIVLFAVSELRKLQTTQRPKRHRRRSLETATSGFGQMELIIILAGVAAALSSLGLLETASSQIWRPWL